MTVDDNQRIGRLACVRNDDLADILTITSNQNRLLLIITPLVSHDFLIITRPIEILDTLAELITNVTVTPAQIKQLDRSDAYVRIRLCRRNQTSKAEQAAAHVEILRMPCVTHVVNDIIGIVGQHAA